MTHNPTYKKILQTAQDLIAQEPYNEVSLNMIAGKAGIAKPSLYYYFTSKEELFRRLFDEMSAEFERRLEAALEQEAGPYTRLRLFIETYVNFFFTKKNLIQVLIQKYSKQDKMVYKRIKQAREEILAKLEGIMDQALQEQGRSGKIDARTASMMLLGMLSPHFVEHLEKDRTQISPGKIADQALSFLDFDKK